MSVRHEHNLQAAMLTVAKALLGDPNKALTKGNKLRFGSKGSLSVDIGRGTWFDFEADQGGGVLDLIRRERRCDTAGALSWLEQIGEIEPAPPEPKHREPDRKLDDRIAAARRIWNETCPIEGTLAQAYLRMRGFDFPLPAALRFHPNCPFAPATRHPCMVAAMTDQAGAIRAIHRTALNPDATKISRLTLGDANRGAAVVLDDAGTESLVMSVCEGIETGLARRLRGDPIVRAAGSTSGMMNFRAPQWVERLWICADYDKGGMAAARKCATAHSDVLIWSTIIRPERVKTDFADEMGVDQ